jgi:hypothetical protein
MSNVIKFMLRAVAVVAFASAVSPLAYSQSAEQKLKEAMDNEARRRAGEDEQRMAAWELRMAEVRRPPERRRDASLAYTQIREDYKQIQIVNNDLAKTSSAGGALDLKYVEKSVSEIKRRAERLKANLMLPEPKKPASSAKQENSSDAQLLKSSLIVLDNLVMEFVNSPIFEQSKAVNVEQAARARLNLEQIIELAEQIKKSTEKVKSLSRK